jgi:hypothetical protein
MVRRRWDYFVRYLMGAEPPKEYELKGLPGVDLGATAGEDAAGSALATRNSQEGRSR